MSVDLAAPTRATQARADVARVAATSTCTPAAQGHVPTSDVDAWFDTAAVLGRRGYRHLPAVARLVLAAGRSALAALPEGVLDAVEPVRRTAWVATSAAAADVHAPMDRVVRDEGAELLSPLGAPYFSLNLAGGRLSTELVAHGGVTTFTTPGTGGLDALAAALTAVRRGATDLALVVAAETAPPPGEPDHGVTATGAAALVLTRAAGDGPAVRVTRTRWRTGGAAAAIAHLRGDAPDVHLVLGADPARDLDAALVERAVVAPGAGVLAAFAAVVDACERGAGAVVALTDDGGAVGAHVASP